MRGRRLLVPNIIAIVTDDDKVWFSPVLATAGDLTRLGTSRVIHASAFDF